jgi:hypothetical protein
LIGVVACATREGDAKAEVAAAAIEATIEHIVAAGADDPFDAEKLVCGQNGVAATEEVGGDDHDLAHAQVRHDAEALVAEVVEETCIAGGIDIATPVAMSVADAKSWFLALDAQLKSLREELAEEQRRTAERVRERIEAVKSGQPPARYVLALGYAGWSAGQLESELHNNVWLIGDLERGIIFDDAHEKKWTRAIRGLGIDPSMLTGESGRA